MRAPRGSPVTLMTDRQGYRFDLELMILAAMDRGASYAHQMKQWIMKCGGPKIYVTQYLGMLDKLEHEGCIVMERVEIMERPPAKKRLYALTNKGRLMLRETRDFYAKVCRVGERTDG